MAVPTGGTRTNVGNVYTHTFLASGTFNTDTPLSATVLLVGGGGGGGVYGGGGGGGAGIYDAPLTIPAGSHAVTVGAGGHNPTHGAVAPGSSIGSLLSVLGGANSGPPDTAGYGGGGGGGAGGSSGNSRAGGNGPRSSGGPSGPQWEPPAYTGGGGGGWSAHGGSGRWDDIVSGGPGGAGWTRPSTGLTYGGGGGGGGGFDVAGGASGGSGGGQGGEQTNVGINGTPNTGGGAGGSANNGAWSIGGSGIVIITYTYVDPLPVNTTPPVIGAGVGEGGGVPYTPGVWTNTTKVEVRWTLGGLPMPNAFLVPYGHAGEILRVEERGIGPTGVTVTVSAQVTVLAGPPPKWVALGTRPGKVYLPYPDVIKADAPLVYYRLAEASGLVALDQSGNGRNGTILGAPTLGIPGVTSDGDKAMRCDGVDDTVTIPNTVTIPVGGSLTLEWWQLLRTGDIKVNTIVGIGPGTGANRISAHGPWTDGTFYFDIGDLNTARVTFPYTTKYRGKWTHIVLTYNAATLERCAYLDGQLAARVVAAAATLTPMSGGFIGGNSDGFWKGGLDEFAVYNYALSQNQILAHFAANAYQAEILRDVPRGYWRMEGETGLLPRDSSGNEQTATTSLAGASYTWEQAGKVGAGIKFNASCFGVPANGGLDLGDEWTTEAWVKIDAIPGSQWGIISKGASSYYMRVENGTGKVQLLKSGVANIASSTIPLSLGVWHHVVGTKKGADVHIYIDGVDVTGAVTNAVTVNGPNNLILGGDHGGGEPTSAYLDEVALYPQALTADRVKAHFDAASPIVAPKWVPLEKYMAEPARKDWVRIKDDRV